MPANIKDIFLDALDVPVAQRPAWLEANCPDEAARRKVMDLLAAHEVAPTFAPPKPATASGLADASPLHAPEAEGDLIAGGKYELLRRLGEGGFGVVFLARQHTPVDRPVAIKLLKFPGAGSQIARRFDAERQVLARMDHPQIARVFDAGTTERGRPYFVMEYVDGLPITDFCYARKMLLVNRLELFAQVCMAVQHAHGKGVIHRDIKPGNILVSVVDGTPTPKVIDFGIAKAVDPHGDHDDDAAAPQMTQEMQIIGTPQYMAPEQATLGRKHIDTRSDIYSLGTVLYELIASTPPFDPGELRKVGLDEVCRIVRERSPTRPSTRIATDANWPRIRRRRLSRLVAGEVDWIVMRAMEKDPARRYPTAAALADDLRRFIRHEPVHARPPSRLYAARKFVQRHRPEVVLSTLAILSLLGIAVVSTIKERQARAASELARQNETRAVQSAERARAAEARAVKNADRALAAEARAVEKAEQAAAQLARADAIAGFTRTMLGGIGASVARGRDTSLLKDLLERATRNVDPAVAQRPRVDLVVRAMIAQAQFDLGDFERAARTIQPAFDRTRDDPQLRDAAERLRAGTLLASIQSERGDGPGSLAIAREVVDGYARAADPALAGDAINARIALASTQRRSRLFAEALATDEAVLAELEAADAADGDLGLLVRNAIASLLVDLRRHTEALARWEAVLAIQQRRHGANHPGTLATMSNLAIVYDATGQPAKAELYNRLVLEQERRLYEPGHPILVKTMNNLASVLMTLDRIDEAAALVEEASAICAAKPESTQRFARPLMVQTMELRLRQRRFDDAVAIGQSLRDGYAAEFGEQSARTVSVETLLLGCLADAGRFEEAWQRLKKLPLDALPKDLSDEQRAALHAAAAHVAGGAGHADEASRLLAIARTFAKPVERGGAAVARRIAKAEATTRPAADVAGR